MKKALSMILVLTMVLALALPAMAAETEIKPTEGASSTDVKATYKAPQDKISGNVYTATIGWEASATETPLTFTGATTAYVWNPTNMQYEKKDNVEGKSEAAKWTGNAGYVVTVTNKSNAEIAYNVTATNTYNLTLTGSDKDGATFTTIDNPVSGINDENVAGTGKGAANGEAAEATKGTKTVTYTANDSARTDVSLTNQELVVGTITVKIQTKTTGSN